MICFSILLSIPLYSVYNYKYSTVLHFKTEELNFYFVESFKTFTSYYKKKNITILPSLLVTNENYILSHIVQRTAFRHNRNMVLEVKKK